MRKVIKNFNSRVVHSLLLLNWLDGQVNFNLLHLFCHFLTFLLVDVSLFGYCIFFSLLYCGNILL